MSIKRTLGTIMIGFLLGAAFIAATNADATKPDPEHKVWVCHATAGYASLGNGYNLIHVDTASTRYQGHLLHATTHPKDNVYFGILYDLIDVNPEEECGGPPETTTTIPTTTVAPTTTVPATIPPTTTGTQPPRTTDVPTTTPEAPAVTAAPPAVAQPAIQDAVKAEPQFTG